MTGRLRFDPVLFDLDGTLVDSGLDIARSVNAALRDMGLSEQPLTAIQHMVGDGVRTLMERALSAAGREGDFSRAVELFRRHYRTHALDHTRPYPGIARLLASLPREAVGVVTNKPAEFARQVLEGLGLASFVGALVGGDETEKLKPHPQPLLEVCRRLGRPPAGGIMVGDFANDILAGRAAGMRTCGVLWGFAGSDSVTAARPDYLCREVPELEALLFASRVIE